MSPSPMGEDAWAIDVQDLEIRAGDRVLIRDGRFQVAAGELCLLVGASGSGKSLTLAALSGLLRPGDGVEVTGSMRVLGQDPLSSPSAALEGCGVLFQDFALFDDLDARGNVRFGADHADSGPEDRDEVVRELLAELQVPADVLPAHLSGGLRQRLALARTLAYQPRLVFFDEPTSGLDPAMSLRVAELVRETHDRHRMTSLVVTHDLGALLDIADRVIFLDPRTRGFREVSAGEVEETMAALRHFEAEEPPPPARPAGLCAALHAFLEGAGSFVIGAARTVAALYPRYPRARWGFHHLWHAFRLTTFGTALPFLALAGLIAGFITTYFEFSLLPHRGYTEPVLIEDFLGALGFGLYRVVIPVTCCLLFASRSGAAAAADVGNRVLTRQSDALRSYGVPPERYLLTGLALASVVGIPLLFLTAYGLARAAALCVFLSSHPGHGAYFFTTHINELLGSFGPFLGGTGYVLGKLLLCGLGTAGIAYFTAAAPKRSGAEVAKGVTDTIIRATIFVLVVHLVFAFFEF